MKIIFNIYLFFRIENKSITATFSNAIFNK